MHCIIHEEFWLVLQLFEVCCLPNILFALINIALLSSSEIVSVSDDSTVESDVAVVGSCIGCGGFSFTAVGLIGIVLDLEVVMVGNIFLLDLRSVVVEGGVEILNMRRFIFK